MASTSAPARGTPRGTPGTIFGNTRWFHNHNARTTGQHLRIKLPGGQENLGLKVVAAITPRSRYTCVTRLRFAPGFNWGQRNDIKLPCGLGGGTLPTGGSPDRDGGWTVRMVIIGSNRHLGAYVYHADQSRIYGDFIDTGVRAEAGRWYTLRLQAHRTTGGGRNGWLGVDINGSRRVSRAMRWSRRPVDADTVFATCFRGGSGNPPGRDTFIDVDYLQWR